MVIGRILPWRKCCTAAPYVGGRVSGLINAAAACCIELHAPKEVPGCYSRSGLLRVPAEALHIAQVTVVLISKPRIGCCMLQSMYLDPKLSLLSPNGPSRWYRYPPTPNIFLAPITDILTVVEPGTTTGCSYSLTQNESKTATLKLKCPLNNVST